MTELLVVILIVGLVSAVALPVVLPALAHRQVGEASRILQGALVGARDQAIHGGQPSGIRLLPDPVFLARQGPTLPDGSANPQVGWVDLTQPLAWSRIIPIGPAPDYQEGAVTVRVGWSYAATIVNPAGANVVVPSLVLEEAPVTAQGLPNAPANWAWNVRVGDQVQLNGAGPWYTVAGPVWTANPEGFVNWGPAGTQSPLNPTGQHRVEWLILVDGRDDNANGWTDEGWDGVDNDANPQSPGYGLIDDPGECEPERWHGAAASGLISVPYTIRRRPLPASNAREVALPTQMVIDAARSRLPVDPRTGTVDLLVQPDGTATPSLPYGVPTSLGLGSEFEHFALVNRADVVAPNASPLPPPKEDWSILTLFRRTGQVLVSDNPDPANPYAYAQQGGR